MRSGLKGIGLSIFILLSTTACDQWALDSFYKFCEQNAGFLPVEKIDIDGAEFRGEFSHASLPNYRRWFDFAAFYEFTPELLSGGTGDYQEDSSFYWHDQSKRNEDLNITQNALYRVSGFDRFESECELFYRYAYGVGETPSEKPLPTRKERDAIASGEGGCMGMREADARISDVIVEAFFTPVATRVYFAPVAEYRLLVTSRDANEVLADLREYTKEPRLFLFLDVFRGQAPARCNASGNDRPRPKWSVRHSVIALSHVFK